MNAAAGRRTTIVAASVLLFAALSSSVLALRQVDRVRGDAEIQEVLYIPSSRSLKFLSLGYTGLMADIYWTRVVQYFGGKHYAGSMQYKLLEPLLDITTTLDPHLLPAYTVGSIFLAQQPPQGGGSPEAAARLVQRGIEANPSEWRLWYHLGTIYWLEMDDAARASDAFLQGSKVPGAQPWMKTVAAALAQHAGQKETARYLWAHIYESTEDPRIKDTARKRLEALQVESDIAVLQERVDGFRSVTGRSAERWSDLVSAGFLGGIPRAPLGEQYQLSQGKVRVPDPKKYPFLNQASPSRKAVPPGISDTN